MKIHKLLPVLVIAIMLYGCITVEKENLRTYGSVKVDGRNIYIDDSLYAEVLLLGNSLSDGWCRAIIIHYRQTNKYEWISPEKGWGLQRGNEIIKDVPTLIRIWNKSVQSIQVITGNGHINGDRWSKLEWRSYDKISPDGEYVYYREAGLFGPTIKKYKIK